MRNIIRDRYLAGVADAEAMFDYSEGDEDALTGALGQAISTTEPLIYHSNGNKYSYRIYYRKLRGRGFNAPEKIFGADGIFQLEVNDQSDRCLLKKGLPFQAKKLWGKTDKKLVSQSKKILETLKQGIVINYTPSGYKACSAQEVVEMGGSNKSLLTNKRLQPLGQVLGNDFLNCDIGIKGLYFDTAQEIFTEQYVAPSNIFHVIDTSIKKLSEE